MKEGSIFDLILVFTPSIISGIVAAILGYFLGVRQTKKQALNRYIAETSGKLYPRLYSEIQDNLALLYNYLENPNKNFQFMVLDEIYQRGLERFIETHHKDLFFMLGTFQNKIVPKIRELDALFLDIWNQTFPAWSEYLKESLPPEIKDENRNISHDLSKTTGPNYVLPDFFNERYDVVKSKIRECVAEKTAHIYEDIERTAPEIYRQLEYPDLEEISQSLIDMTKPKTTHFIQEHNKLRDLANEEVKLKLLPLLQKYISSPI